MSPVVNITINRTENCLIVVRAKVQMNHIVANYEKYSSTEYIEENIKAIFNDLIARYGLNMTINIQDGRND